MAAQFIWTITDMTCKPAEGDLTNVVVAAAWTCVGSDSGFSSMNYGACGFPPPGDPFIAYDSLTQEQVIEWCWGNGVDKDAVEAGIQSKLDALISPPYTNPPLPWVPPPVEPPLPGVLEPTNNDPIPKDGAPVETPVETPVEAPVEAPVEPTDPQTPGA